MIKEKIIQLTADMVGEKYALRTVAYHVENAFNTIVGQLFNTDPDQHNFYCKPFDASVTRERGLTYATLPKPVIQTPDNGKGVRMVTDKEGLNEFYPVPQSALRSSADATELAEFVWYTPKTDRVEFKNLPKVVETVTMWLVLPFAEWGDHDDIPLPSGVADNIIMLAAQTFSGNTDGQTNPFKKK